MLNLKNFKSWIDVRFVSAEWADANDSNDDGDEYMTFGMAVLGHLMVAATAAWSKRKIHNGRVDGWMYACPTGLQHIPCHGVE